MLLSALSPPSLSLVKKKVCALGQVFMSLNSRSHMPGSILAFIVPVTTICLIW